MYTRQYKTKKTSTNSAETSTTNQFAPRRFVVQPDEEITNNQTSDLQAKSDKKRNLPNISVFPSGVTPQPSPIQMKLTIGQPGDKYEQEADRLVADVVQQINAPETQQVQREAAPEEEEVQMKPISGSIQREPAPEEEEVQMKPMVQRLSGAGGMSATPDLEQSIQQARKIKLQEMANNSLQAQQAAQLQIAANHPAQQQQPSQKKVSSEPSVKENNTGLPDDLKIGVENLSGYSLDDVRVNYNSPKPAQLQALAYTQGTEIYVASGQEKHLPHEAWHVVQQAQGRVQPTMQMKDGVPVNDDAGLEREADVMGAKAMVPAAQRPAASNAETVADDRPEAVAQYELADTDNDSQISTAQQAPIRAVLSSLCTTQRMVKVELETDDDTKKSLVAEGKVQDFKNGTTAGKRGWVGVDKYRAYYVITSSDGKYEDRGDSLTLKNTFTNGESGHVLGKQNGGNGQDSNNVFAQDGGTNNGKYKSFEIDMQKMLNKYGKKDNVLFKSYLVGEEIKKGLIADTAMSEASEISSDESSDKSSDESSDKSSDDSMDDSSD